MQAKLFSHTGETRGFELLFDDEAVIGRDSKNQLVIDQPLMSGRHARIAYDRDDGRFVLEDLDSLNGTQLDGDPIIGKERLGHLHVITFAGTYDFFFQDLERCAKRHPAQATRPPETVAEAATTAEDDAAKSSTTEITSIENEPVLMPGFLAQRADAVGDQSPKDLGTDRGFSEVTSIEREPAALPANLGQRADQELAASRENASPDRSPELTQHEKLPIALPDILTHRAEAARRADTLDLTDIEELLSEDSGLHSEEPSTDERSGLHLVVTEPDGGVRHFAVAEGENVIGRSSSVQVSMAYPDLSRRHAVLTVGGDRITLRDLSSRNRTFLDDQPIDAETEAEVRIGSRLRFGSIEARLVSTTRDGETPDRGTGDPHES